MLGHIDAKPKVGYFPGKAGAGNGDVHRKLRNLAVKDRMGRPVVIPDSATVNDAVISLFLENVGSLMVADETGSLCGLVSQKDLLKVTLGNPNAASVPICMVMTRVPHLVTVRPDDSILDAARKLMDHQVDALPVVRTVGAPGESARMEIAGRITKTHITRLMLDIALDL